MRVSSPRSVPLSLAELSRGKRLLGIRSARQEGAPAQQKRYEAYRALCGLARDLGEVHALDVKVAGQKLGRDAASSLRRLFSELEREKKRGRLADARAPSVITSDQLDQIRGHQLPKNVVAHAERVAGLEVYQLFDHPVRDTEIRALIERFLRSEFRVRRPTFRRRELKADVTLREAAARKRNALLVLLGRKDLPSDLLAACVAKLGECGEPADIGAVKAVARGAKAESVQAAARLTEERLRTAGRMTIVLASMEVKPYVNGGGLGNVLKELPKALAAMGHRVIVLMPQHTNIDRNTLEATEHAGVVYSPRGAEEFRLNKDHRDGVDIYFIENDRYFSRGRFGVYGDEHGDYGDNCERYDFFGAAIPVAIRSILGPEAPDVVQLNDAHTATAAVYLKRDPAFKKTKTIMALHNLGAAYQGRFDKKHLKNLGIEGLGLYHAGGPAEFYDQLNLLKLGLVESDGTIAVSREYADEILEAPMGEGLHGVLRWLRVKDRLWGNMNGIDTDSWNPATDPVLPARYSFEDQAGKGECKADLQRRYGLAVDPETPVMGVVARLAEQKGFDDIIGAIERAIANDQKVQFVVCGTGDARIARRLRELAEEHPHKVAFDPAFSADKERRIIAGSDFFLMPSKFEPCGLPQMYALRYLTVPIVRAVGGLEESIVEYGEGHPKGTGFKFERDLAPAVDRALAWFEGGAEGRAKLVRNCALSDFSWEHRSAPEQLAFYRKIMCS